MSFLCSFVRYYYFYFVDIVKKKINVFIYVIKTIGTKLLSLELLQNAIRSYCHCFNEIISNKFATPREEIIKRLVIIFTWFIRLLASLISFHAEFIFILQYILEEKNKVTASWTLGNSILNLYFIYFKVRCISKSVI